MKFHLTDPVQVAEAIEESVPKARADRVVNACPIGWCDRPTRALDRVLLHALVLACARSGVPPEITC